MIRPAREQSFSVPKVAPVETLGERLVNACQQFTGGAAGAVVASLRASIAETRPQFALRRITAMAKRGISQRTILAAPQKG